MVDFGCVGKLMSPNNAERTAEVAYNNQKTSQRWWCSEVSGKLVNGHSSEKWAMASVLAEERSTDEQDRYRSEYNAVYATGYVKAFTQEPVASARRKICNAIAPLAARAPFLSCFRSCSVLGHSDANHRESAVSLSKICEYAVDIVVPHVANFTLVKVGLSNGQPMNRSRLDVLLWMLSTRCKSEWQE